MTTTEETTVPTLTDAPPDVERTAEQVRRLFALLDRRGTNRARELAAWAALQLDTGCRPSELAALTWDDLALADGGRGVRFSRIRLGGRDVELRTFTGYLTGQADRRRLPHARVCFVSRFAAARVATHRATRGVPDLLPVAGRDPVFWPSPYRMRSALAELTGDPAFRLKSLAQSWAVLVSTETPWWLNPSAWKSAGLLSHHGNPSQRYVLPHVEHAHVLDTVMAAPAAARSA